MSTAEAFHFQPTLRVNVVAVVNIIFVIISGRFIKLVACKVAADCVSDVRKAAAKRRLCKDLKAQPSSAGFRLAAPRCRS